jgi:hypothetical protein
LLRDRNAAPDSLRGTAFGIYELAVGISTFAASAGTGVLWMAGRPGLAFAMSAVIAGAAVPLLSLQRISNRAALPPKANWFDHRTKPSRMIE